MAGYTRKGANAGAELRKVEAQAAKGWPAGLVVLCGDDAYHLDAAQRTILDALLPAQEREYALTVYGDEKVPVGTVISACRSMGMFASRRVVLVRELALLSDEIDALVEYVNAPPPRSHLIIRAVKLDRRLKLDKLIAAKGMLFPFQIDADPLSALAEIKTLAKQHELSLSQDAATLLAEICAGDFYRICSELAKLSAWSGGKSRVSVDDVRETIAGEGTLGGWAMANALLARDRPAALASARRLVEAGEAPIKIVGGLAFRARTMLTAKAMLDAGRPLRQVVQASRAWSFENELMRGLARYELHELLAFPTHLLAADLALKSRQIAPGAVVESLVDRMLGTDRATHKGTG